MNAQDDPGLGTAQRSCPVCGAAPEVARVLRDERVDEAALDRFAFASRKLPELMDRRLLECPSCGVAFASPAPSAEGVAAAYRGAEFDTANEARQAAITYQGLIRRVVPLLPPGPALDIGAGDGAFVRLGGLPVRLPVGNLAAIAWKQAAA